MKTKFTETGEMGSGLLAPFTYFRIELIDLSSVRVLAEERVTAAQTLSIASTTASHAWNALSAAEKVRVLREMIATETARALPKLLTAAP